MANHKNSGGLATKDNVSITQDEISHDEISQSDTPYIDISLDIDEEEVQRRNNSKWFQVKKFWWDGTGKHPKEQQYLMKLIFLINIVMFGVLYQELEPNECNYCLCQWYG